MSDKVTHWLQQLGLGEYAAGFAGNDIDWELLPELDQEILKEIGIHSAGHRLRILKAVRALQPDPIVTDPPAVKKAESQAPNTTPYEAQRRQLTVMFCDLVGSTALSERHDLESYREVLSAYHDAAREAIIRYDGYIARYMGDGLLVYFGYPTAHEDDAERSVRAGLDVVEMVSKLEVPGAERLRVRVGIATGRVVAGDIVGEGASEEHAVLGETPNLAARLQGLAEPNSVIVAEVTQRLVEGRFEFEALKPQSVKGFRKPVSAFKAIAIKETHRFEAATTRGVSAIVGRRSELQLLIERWTQAREGEGQVVLLSGEAGIGKSRMLREFRDCMGRNHHTTLRYQCSPYGSKTAFSPIIEQLQRRAGMARLELDLRTALGAVKVATLGWANSSVSSVYEPAFDLAEAFDDRQALGLILFGLCVHYWTRAEFPETRHWLAKLEGVAEQSEDSALSVIRDMSAGCQYFWQAEYDRAYRYTANIRATYDESRHASIAAYTNHDPLCFSLHWAGSLLQWIIGYPDRGLDLVDEAGRLPARVTLKRDTH